MKKQTRVTHMTEGNPTRQILFFSVSLMLGNIFQQMYTMVDTIIVGRGVGVNALAALGVCDWFNWLFMSLSTGLTQGFGILIAQKFGAGHIPRLRKSIGISIFLSVCAAVLLTSMAQLSILPALRLMHTDPLIFGDAHTYLRIMFAGIPVVLAYNMAATMLRSMGDSRSPLTAMVIASITNVVLDLVFVMGFGFGVAGAACATILAQAVSFIYCAFTIRKVEILRLERTDLKIENEQDRRMAFNLLKVGMPVVFMNLIISVGGMVVVSVVNRNGVLFVAGYTATNKMYGLFECAAVSMGLGITTYVGQNYGAGLYDRIRSGIKSSVMIAVLFSLATSAIMLIGGRSLIGLFISADPSVRGEVIEIGYTYLKIMSFYLVILYMLYVFRSGLQGIGNTVMPMVSGLGEFIMRVSGAALLPGILGETGIFYAEVLAWTGAALILFVSFCVCMRRIEKKRETMQEKTADSIA